MNPMPVSLHELFAPDTPTSCMVYTDGSKRCGYAVPQQNLQLARGIWNAIAAGADATWVNEEIEKLAAYCLCKRRHQDQKTEITNIWRTQYRTWRYHQTVAAGLHTILLPNTATETTPVDQIKTEMYAQLDCHQQRYEDIAHEQAVSLRKQSQPDVEMSDAF
ncbi:hypothetical protein KCU71_g5441, partial [Aureobasidium melanogenum]